MLEPPAVPPTEFAGLLDRAGKTFSSFQLLLPGCGLQGLQDVRCYVKLLLQNRFGATLVHANVTRGIDRC